MYDARRSKAGPHTGGCPSPRAHLACRLPPAQGQVCLLVPHPFRVRAQLPAAPQKRGSTCDQTARAAAAQQSTCSKQPALEVRAARHAARQQRTCTASGGGALCGAAAVARPSTHTIDRLGCTSRCVQAAPARPQQHHPSTSSARCGTATPCTM